MKRLYLFLLVCFVCGAGVAQPSAARAKNVVIFLMDGYRWRELFKGADSAILFDKRYNYIDSAYTVTKYWSPDADQRRRKLMPFVWETMAAKGQLWGNRELGSSVQVRNKYWFSYPGRSEAFCGYYDSAINSNEYPDNPNENVLEYINKQPGYQGKVATFASWDVVAHILARKRNGMLVNIYGEDVKSATLSPAQVEANRMQHLLPDIFGAGERLDGSTYLMARAYMAAEHPRVLYVDLGDPDDFAHGRDYGSYLDAAHYADAMFKDVWELIESDPFYKGQTSLVVFPDHGRGVGPKWTDHGAKAEHSNETYFLAMGAGVEARGEVRGGAPVWDEQFGATIAALLGMTFVAGHPVAAPIGLH
jgi:hypothetical protein